ncbi:hypothetical protein B5P44_00500 [Mycobacterium sp. CBMA 213]|uniref:Ribbon-helix-helix protein CopG domain-containing protein n=1 Tax=Mycolicibacterium sp. CBMA 213 TaxID=1968788 RepID=A0A343VR80_9MYCO|nr:MULTISPECIES: hypothetical protein [unclassified Mycolicibacterium]AVN58404.1 hypothetical protein B5P44_p00109 [Mycolicibacterium sp. CBMA 213]MUL61064.1 hypothetical protein [Mycolicibacterium sp. CBMA 335]MUM03303.1 hypothetical protein [Mycolicibacterium sp. CBMA 213]
MARINVYETDEYTGTRTLAGWFDISKAEGFAEDTRWDGNNTVGLSSGVPTNFGGDQLIHTSGGRWVLYRDRSRYFNGRDTHHFVSENVAREWLLTNGHDDDAATYFGPTEEERGPGRPEVGKPINVRLGDLLADVDDYAADNDLSRAEAIRSLIAIAVGSIKEARQKASADR